jgi:uncharacterized protein (TIGR02598 family)
MKRQHPNQWIGNRAGFSLIEVAISTGIVAFAMVGILGMVPVGLASFRQARENTVEPDIVQALTSELDTTTFANISSMAYPAQTYYYDAEGNSITPVGSAPPSNAIYTAKISLQSISATATATSTFPVNLPNEAYNVQIQIANITGAGQPHTYSVIVANKNY